MKPVRAVIDTCIWISAYIESENDHVRARNLIDEVLRGRHRIFMPYAELTEIVCRLAAKYRQLRRDPIDVTRLGHAIVKIPRIVFAPTDDTSCIKAADLG